MNVVSISDVTANRRKQDLLEILEDLKSKVEDGEIVEFVAAGLSVDGETMIHACVQDFVGGVGLFELGKHILLMQQS
jgi:hypothetical protein